MLRGRGPRESAKCFADDVGRLSGLDGDDDSWIESSLQLFGSSVFPKRRRGDEVGLTFLPFCSLTLFVGRYIVC